MTTIIINPGTQADNSATLDKARIVAERLHEDLGLSDPISRDPDHDRDGWFRFIFTAGPKTVEVDIPGDDPDVVCEGRPFKSRRLYVDGSSWLYGFAVGIAANHLGLEA